MTPHDKKCFTCAKLIPAGTVYRTARGTQAPEGAVFCDDKCAGIPAPNSYPNHRCRDAHNELCAPDHCNYADCPYDKNASVV